MSRLTDMIQGEPVHSRHITIKTWEVPEDRVLVEGCLRDDRYIPIYHWSGEQRDPDVIHNMVIRMLVGGHPLRILDVEAEMPNVPYHLCTDMRESVERVKGLEIVAGYSTRVRKLLGGIAGCAHLTHLIVTMGPAALHGYWTAMAAKPRTRPVSADDIPDLKYLVNSCWLWREGGPYLDILKEQIEEVIGSQSAGADGD